MRISYLALLYYLQLVVGPIIPESRSEGKILLPLQSDQRYSSYPAKLTSQECPVDEYRVQLRIFTLTNGDSKECPVGQHYLCTKDPKSGKIVEDCIHLLTCYIGTAPLMAVTEKDGAADIRISCQQCSADTYQPGNVTSEVGVLGCTMRRINNRNYYEITVIDPGSPERPAAWTCRSDDGYYDVYGQMNCTNVNPCTCTQTDITKYCNEDRPILHPDGSCGPSTRSDGKNDERSESHVDIPTTESSTPHSSTTSPPATRETQDSSKTVAIVVGVVGSVAVVGVICFIQREKIHRILDHRSGQRRGRYSEEEIEAGENVRLTQSGAEANGQVQSGTGANGQVQRGNEADGQVQHGTEADGQVQRGTEGDGQVQRGTEANGQVQSGTGANGQVQRGTEADGQVQHGTEANGQVQSGTGANGQVQRGTEADGQVQRGTEADGQNRICSQGLKTGGPTIVNVYGSSSTVNIGEVICYNKGKHDSSDRRSAASGDDSTDQSEETSQKESVEAQENIPFGQQPDGDPNNRDRIRQYPRNNLTGTAHNQAEEVFQAEGIVAEPADP